MDYIHEAEKKLWHYRDLERSLKYQERQILKLKWAGAPADMSSANLDGMPKGNKADEMINISCELQMYLNMKAETEQEMKDIDEILDDISQDTGCELYGAVLRKWYIDGIKPKEEIARQLNYSSKTSIYDIRHDAIRKLAVALYGKRALDAI